MSTSTRFARLSVFGVSIALLAAGACKKGISGSNSGSGSISATVAGHTVTGVNITAAKVFQQFSISGTAADKSTTLAVTFLEPFQLNVPLTADSVGTSILFTQTVQPYEFFAGYTYSQAGTAAVTITAWDSVNHQISGTFNGELFTGAGVADSLGLSDSIAVTSGQFNLSYVVQQ